MLKPTACACLLAATIVGCGPTLSVVREGNRRAPRPSDCEIRFAAGLDPQSAALRYELVALLQIKNVDSARSPKVRELVRKKACQLGGQIAVADADARNETEMYLVLGSRRGGSLTIGEVMRTGSAGLRAVAKDETTIDEVSVVVFDVVDRANGLTEQGVEQVSEHLASALEQRPGFRVVKRGELRQRLADRAGKKSAKHVDPKPRRCDVACRIAIGKSFGADKVLMAKLMPVGEGCSLVGLLHDVRTGAAERDATVPTSCSTNVDLLRRVDVLVDQLSR